MSLYYYYIVLRYRCYYMCHVYDHHQYDHYFDVEIADPRRRGSDAEAAAGVVLWDPPRGPPTHQGDQASRGLHMSLGSSIRCVPWCYMIMLNYLCGA